MDETEWKNIIEELTQQISGISIERAVARAEVKKILGILEQQHAKIEELNAKIAELEDSEIQTANSKV